MPKIFCNTCKCWHDVSQECPSAQENATLLQSSSPVEKGKKGKNTMDSKLDVKTIFYIVGVFCLITMTITIGLGHFGIVKPAPSPTDAAVVPQQDSVPQWAQDLNRKMDDTNRKVDDTNSKVSGLQESSTKTSKELDAISVHIIPKEETAQKSAEQDYKDAITKVSIYSGIPEKDIYQFVATHPHNQHQHHSQADISIRDSYNNHRRCHCIDSMNFSSLGCVI